MKRALAVTALILATQPAAALQAPIGKAEYAARRDSLASRIGDGVLIAFGGRTPITDFGPFFQLPAFRYLTGFEYADAALVMVVRGGKGTSTLFVQETEPRMSLYYGQAPDAALIRDSLGLASRPAGDVSRVVDSLVAAGARVVFELRDFAAADFANADSLTRGGAFVASLASRHRGLTVRDAHPLLVQLRARKTDAELALIRKAAEISANGHRELMRQIQPGMHEYDLQAIIESVFRRAGSERPAYGSIVGSGPKGLELHYMKDRRLMQPGEVVVIDAGAEFQGYTADVTRTLPVSGTYTAEQRAIYRIVRDAQAAAERNANPGQTLTAAADSSVEVRARGLAALGLIESPTATFDPPWATSCERSPRSCLQVSLFAIHGITHGIGLEVHDPLQASFGDRKFQVGDAFVIEPGLYVSTKMLDLLPDTPKNRAFIAKVRKTVERYQNIGVRIEDAYVITQRGLEWISRVPRDIDEVEALTRRRAVP